MPVSVLLVDDDEVLRRITATLLTKQGFTVLPVESGPLALENLKTVHPDIILLDVMMPDMDGFSVCQKIRADPTISNIPIIMLTALDNLENKVKGFEAGADDYISKPCDTMELVARINALLRRAVPSQPQEHEREPALAIAVFSLRGGSGVSTISVNLAAGLAQLWGTQVALVDMVSVAGQSALFLNQSLRNTWADLCKIDLDEIDEETVLSAMLPHTSRIRTLASPARPEQGDLLTAEKMGRVIDIMRPCFPYIIFDMPHDLSERSLSALDRSDVILLIAQPEIASLRCASMSLELFNALKYNHKKIYIILNWTFPRQGLASKDIERLLRAKIDLTLPYATDEFIPALNLGIPPVIQNPESPLGIIFEDMAMALSKEEHRNTRPKLPSAAWQRIAGRNREIKQA
jgi:pilus assembly protein CpaE